MAKQGPLSEQLRDYVRARVRKDGAHYERGNGVKLASHLKVDSGWVTTYTDTPPTAHATLDQSIAICEFYGLSLMDLLRGRVRQMPHQSPRDPIVIGAIEAIEKWPSQERHYLVHLVNAIRRMAGLQDLSLPPAQRRGRNG